LRLCAKSIQENIVINVPRLGYDDLRRHADGFLDEYHPSMVFPVPIEEIVDFQFGMHIYPVGGLHLHYNIDSFLSRNLQEIGVDEAVYYSRLGRYRVSLAHELGHRILHPDVFTQMKFDTVFKWKEAMTDSMSEEDYGHMEFQAESFAGLVLVPTSELHAEFVKVAEHYRQHGVPSSPPEIAVMRESSARYLSDEFAVSVSVMEKRLDHDCLWELVVA
jgi:hypothetical protein